MQLLEVKTVFLFGNNGFLGGKINLLEVKMDFRKVKKTWKPATMINDLISLRRPVAMKRSNAKVVSSRENIAPYIPKVLITSAAIT